MRAPAFYRRDRAPLLVSRSRRNNGCRHDHRWRPRVPESLFDQGYTLASVIANEFNEVSSDMYLSALIECGLILFVLTSVVNIGAYFMLRRMNRMNGPVARARRKKKGDR